MSDRNTQKPIIHTFNMMHQLLKTFYIVISVIMLSVLLSVFGCKQEAGKEAAATLREKSNDVTPSVAQTDTTHANPYAGMTISTRIFEAEGGSFGYDILAEGRTLIHQPHAPALPGNLGFKTRAQAQKVADFVVEKVKKGEMPPTISVEDLKKLEAL
jgi:hypothetical protein